tara:strand:+ start:340 stop:1092 length:753 start_codon:yes stop_codon:yes gene_type:complete
MSELYVNVGGTWKTASNYYVNVNGTWKEGSEIHAISIIRTNLEFYINPSSYISGTTVADLSGNNRTYDLVNGVTHNTSPSRFTLDGTDDYLEVASDYSVTTTNATFIMWIKRDGEQSTYTGLMVNRIDASDTSGMVFRATSEEIGYMINNNGFLWQSGLVVADATWTMVAIAVNSTTVKAYRYTSSSTPSTATNTNSHSSYTYSNLELGRDNYGGRYFKGDIGHSLFYSSTLTDSDITQIYNATKATYGY